jgi:hypothetical protein
LLETRGPGPAQHEYAQPHQASVVSIAAMHSRWRLPGQTRLRWPPSLARECAAGVPQKADHFGPVGSRQPRAKTGREGVPTGAPDERGAKGRHEVSGFTFDIAKALKRKGKRRSASVPSVPRPMAPAASCHACRWAAWAGGTGILLRPRPPVEETGVERPGPRESLRDEPHARSKRRPQRGVPAALPSGPITLSAAPT